MRIVALIFIALLTAVLPALSDRHDQHENSVDTRNLSSEERYSNTFAVEVFGDEELAKQIAQKYSFLYSGKVRTSFTVVFNSTK